MADTATTHLGLTNRDWTGLALAGAGALPALFGGGKSDANINDVIRDMEASTKRLTAQSGQLNAEGSSALGPALQYLKALTGGDRNAMLAATMPERRGVLDQYDTARKAITEFAPRGGGTAGALAQLGARESGDLATITGGARRDAVNTSANLGATLQGLGLNAEGAANQNLSTILQTYLQQAQQQGHSAADIGLGLAQIVGMLFL